MDTPTSTGATVATTGKPQTTEKIASITRKTTVRMACAITFVFAVMIGVSTFTQDSHFTEQTTTSKQTITELIAAQAAGGLR